MYAPIILEFIVFAIYSVASGREFNFASVLWALMLFAPAVFFYMISPMLIYFIGGAGKYYEKNLRENIDSLFIFSDDEDRLTNEQKDKIRQEINEKLVPELVGEVRGLYIDSYINRSQDNKKNGLLTSFETLFLFSLIWSMFSLADFVGVIILHYTPIALDFIYIDQISNPINVIIFALLFITLTILSDILAFYSLDRSRQLLLETLPIVIHVDEEEQIKRNNYIRALSQFPIEGLVGDKLLRKHSRRIDSIYEREFSDYLSEALRVYARNQVAKQQAWRIYKPILDNLKVSAEQTAVIKDRFFDSPFYEIARDVFSYDHELLSLKTDIEYVKNRLKMWSKITEEDRSTSLVFLFRSTEQLFKSILDKFDAPVEVYTNFSVMIQYLRDKALITAKDEQSFNNIRKKRNTLVHQSGRIVTIKKDEIEDFLQSLESVLLKVEKRFKKSGDEE